ncbi:hypothetical protein B1L02_14495 [Pseudoalteromonas piscicida]|uniref:hypothetical protein n=1 Tax=Pseudoalteromonas piscicida TaxID=43662 RepID=UPI000B50B108|nr:hypothetical protein [Pseudoalteromonas piscicida]ASD68098.1 hypothetical protein B1L02_14495 [Pseudoalteromonas piscicida]
MGINEGDWCGLFGGRNIISPAYRGTVFHRINYASSQVLFSCYHLSRETVKYYVDALNNKRLMWLHGYPSFLSELAGLALTEGLKLKYTPTVITIGAENLSSHQSDLIFRFFGVTPRQHYGLAESVSNISESKDGRFVVDEDFSYTEFIESNVQGCYRIVGSNFTNKAFPLFRYDSGDLAYGVNETVFPREVSAIDGRKEDVIVLKSGAVVGRLDHIFKDAIYVSEAQIIQKRNLSLIIKVVCSDLWEESKHYSELLREFRSRLGDDLDISIECVDRIQRTKSGKLRFVISEVNKVETNTSGHE